jgi:hypothetical protein
MSVDLLSKICASLDIDVETYQIGNLLNNFVEYDSKIKSIKWCDDIRVFTEDDDILPIKKEDLENVVYEEDHIIIVKDIDCHRKIFLVKEGTVLELLDIILEFEKEFRPDSYWFGGIDAHHVYFEGLNSTGTKYEYKISWGS